MESAEFGGRTCFGRDGLISGAVVHHVGPSDELPLLVADALGLVHVEAVDCRLVVRTNRFKFGRARGDPEQSTGERERETRERKGGRETEIK